MKFAITIVAFAEIGVLLASALALRIFGGRKLWRLVAGEEDTGLSAASHRTYTRLSGAQPVKSWLGELGVHVSDDEARAISAVVRAHSIRTKAIPSHTELRELAEGVINKAA